MAWNKPSTWFEKATPAEAEAEATAALPAGAAAPASPAPAPTEQGPTPFVAIGTTGLKRFGGYVDEELLTKLAGPRAAKVFREMGDNDAVVGAILYIIEMLMRQAEWRTEPANETARAKEAAELWDTLVDDMDHTWDDFLGEVSTTVQFGWSYFEKVLKRRDDGRIGIRKLAIRSQDSLQRWEFNEDGDVTGMHQQDMYAGAGPVFIPLSRSLLFRTTSRKNNPEGRSLLRNAYRSWFFVKRLQEIEAIGIERDLTGLPVIELPPDLMSARPTPDQRALRQDFEKKVSQIRRDERDGVVIPSELNGDGKPTGYKLRLLSTGGTRAIDPGKAIVRYEQRMAMTLLAEFLFLGMQDVGARALAEEKTSTFGTALAGLMEGIASVVNRKLIPEVMALNGFCREECPKMVVGEIATPDLKALGELISKLVGAGVITPDDALERKVREIAKLPELEHEAPERQHAAGKPTVDAPAAAAVPVDPDAPAEPTSPAADATRDVSDVALNGAQVTAAQGIVEAVAYGKLPRDVGVQMLMTFFGIPKARAELLFGTVGNGFVPTAGAVP